jgi:ABC-2 type transport system ATP-binding protein
VINVDQLYKTYDGFVAVDHVSFQVNGGDVFGLLGPNGAGKTTIIRMLMDIFKPDGGAVSVLGQPPGAARARVGYLPEERGLYRSLRVDECLAYLGQLKGMPRAAAHKRALALLERVELKEWARKKVQELSRGMQQKVQLAASIIHDPDLIILDEPFQGLDPVNVDMVRSLIRELRAQGKTVVLSAHEMSLVEKLCERIALIDHGQVVLYGALADIKKQFSPNAIEISPPLDLAGWPDVARTELRDGKLLVYLRPPATPHQFLKALLDRGVFVDQFELASMPLDQIFVEVVTGQRANYE